jgi:hypothetical protein
MDWRLGAVAHAVAVSDETVIGTSNVVGVSQRDGQVDARAARRFPHGLLGDLVRKRRKPVSATGGGRRSQLAGGRPPLSYRNQAMHVDDKPGGTASWPPSPRRLLEPGPYTRSRRRRTRAAQANAEASAALRVPRAPGSDRRFLLGSRPVLLNVVEGRDVDERRRGAKRGRPRRRGRPVLHRVH